MDIETCSVLNILFITVVLRSKTTRQSIAIKRLLHPPWAVSQWS